VAARHRDVGLRAARPYGLAAFAESAGAGRARHRIAVIVLFRCAPAPISHRSALLGSRASARMIPFAPSFAASRRIVCTIPRSVVYIDRAPLVQRRLRVRGRLLQIHSAAMYTTSMYQRCPSPIPSRRPAWT